MVAKSTTKESFAVANLKSTPTFRLLAKAMMSMITALNYRQIRQQFGLRLRVYSRPSTRSHSKIPEPETGSFGSGPVSVEDSGGTFRRDIPLTLMLIVDLNLVADYAF